MADARERLAAALADRYSIERELGEGGMATVYLAHDERHDRTVALKVLRSELAAVIGGERFLAEIKTTANLQHPNILPLFESGDADGQLFYVMPYVEGETLRTRIEREKQLPIEDVVELGVEVADALDYAHRHGVVHRDVKPENILLHEGRALVADFGVALALSTAGGSRMTETGMSVGTPAYMSPEQAMGGHEVTARSDVYALGATLYEALVGEPPFTGPTAQAIIARLVTEDPRPLVVQRKTIPSHVEAAVLKALERLPADRFTRAAELGEALEGRRAVAPRAGAPTAGVREDARRALVRLSPRGTLAAGGLLVLLLAAALWGWLRPRPTREAPPMLMAFPLGPRDSIAPTPYDAALNYGRPSRTAFAFSPDGRTLVYVGRGGRLFVRSLDSRASTPIAGVDGAESPFFSPDGRSIGYWSRGHLRSVPVAGGPSTDIAAVGEIAGASWGANDRIVVGVRGTGLIFLSPKSATPPDTFADPRASLPRFLPGERSLLFTQSVWWDPWESRVEWLPLDSRKPEILIRNGADARFSPNGYLLFGRDGALMAVGFDAAKHAVLGRPFTVLPDVMQAINGRDLRVITGAMQVALSPLGQLAWMTGGIDPDTRREVVELDRQGHGAPLVGAGVHPFLSVRVSPDGGELALTTRGLQSTLEIYDLARGDEHTVPTTGAQVSTLWYPDGQHIVTWGGTGDSLGLVSVQPDGMGTPRRLGPPGRILPAFWSADGSTLYAILTNHDTLVALDTAGRRVPEAPRLPAPVYDPALSPGGRWLAYVIRDPGSSTLDVYVSPWPALDRRWKVSSGGGWSPAWARGGRELIYLKQAPRDSTGNDSLRVMSVTVGRDTAVAPGVPHFLFASRFDHIGPLRAYDVSPDGSRFFVLRDLPVHAAPGRMYVMSNAFAELDRLAAEQGAGG